MKTLRKVIAIGYIFILMLLGGILFTFIYEWKQVEFQKREVEKIKTLRQNVHDAYALKVDISLHAENMLDWEDEDTVLYHSKRMVIDSLLAEFNRYYKENGIDEIRLLLAQKEKQLFEVWSLMKSYEALNEHAAIQISALTNAGNSHSKKKGFFGNLFRKKGKSTTTEAGAQKSSKIMAEIREQGMSLSEAVHDLSSRNLELNENLMGLISKLDKRLETDLQNNEKKIEAAREDTYLLVRILTGIVSLLLFIIYIAVHQTTRRIRRYEKDKDELIRKLESSLAENGRLLDARQKMMFTITHELRTPLTAIKGYAELLDNSTDEEKRKSYTNNILSASERMSSQLNMLLNFFRLDCGKEEANLILFNTTDIVKTLVAEFQTQIEGKGLVMLTENCTDNIVVGDRERLVQIGNNLLSNACKFTRKGFIRLSASYKEGIYQLCVEDSGTGIPKMEQKRIFKSFERLSNALTQDGFGLGLSIVDNLVRLLEGSMELTSEEGKGSRFVVSIPMKPADAEMVRDIKEEEIYPKRNFEVIVIDDNNMLRDVVKEVFARYNINCDICSHVGELMERIRNRTYDILITDLKMPEMDGFDILRLLRTSNVNNSKTIPVIVSTASGICSETELLERGFDGCLFKPFSAQELMRVSERCVNSRIQEDMEPDLTMLLAYGDRKSMLEKLIVTTEQDMRQVKEAGERKDAEALSRWVHYLRSSWGIIHADKPLWELHELLRRNGSYNDWELEEAVSCILKKGEDIIMKAKRIKGDCK